MPGCSALQPRRPTLATRVATCRVAGCAHARKIARSADAVHVIPREIVNAELTRNVVPGRPVDSRECARSHIWPAFCLPPATELIFFLIKQLVLLSPSTVADCRQFSPIFRVHVGGPRTLSTPMQLINNVIVFLAYKLILARLPQCTKHKQHKAIRGKPDV